MTYRVEITKRAAEQIGKLPKRVQVRVIAAIDSLSSTPRPVGVKKLVGRDDYRVRVGDYRVIYSVTDSILTVRVVKVGHRSDIYEE